MDKEYQDFLKNNPEITLLEAYFEFFSKHPEENLKKLNRNFSSEINYFIFNGGYSGKKNKREDEGMEKAGL